MNKFVYRMLCKNYEQSCRSMLVEMRKVKSQVEQVDDNVFDDYQENLKLLRLFLDSNGAPMPQPKWHYDDKDESTWLFTHRKHLNTNFMLLQSKRR